MVQDRQKNQVFSVPAEAVNFVMKDQASKAKGGKKFTFTISNSQLRFSFG